MQDELDKLAREIVKSQYPEMRDDYKGRRLTIARLALEAGMKLQRERDVVIADDHTLTADDDVQQAYCQAALDIAQAIRSAKP